MTAQCLISFGSNLGNRDALIADAARAVAGSPAVEEMRASRLFETPPIGGPGGQEPFLNAVAAFETTVSAREILKMLQQIENRLGRQRRQRWDARPIDLDVVLHGELVSGGTGLIVPHPRYTARQFVLQPACDVAAHYRDPRFGWTLQRLAQHLSDGVPSLALVGGDVTTRNELCRRLSDEHRIRTFAARPLAEPMPVLGNAPAPVRSDQRRIQRGSSRLRCPNRRWIGRKWVRKRPGACSVAHSSPRSRPAVGFGVCSPTSSARKPRNLQPQRPAIDREDAIGNAGNTLAGTAPDVAGGLAMA